MSPLQEFRHRRALDLAELAIDTAKAMLAPVLPPTGGPWRRAVRSKCKRIRLKGEKMREPVWALKRSIVQTMVGLKAQTQASVLLSQMPPRAMPAYPDGFKELVDAARHHRSGIIPSREMIGGSVSIGQRCRVIDEPGAHPVHGAYDSRVVVE